MKSTLISSKLQVKISDIHGYGVFALEGIKAEDIIEECYTLLHKKDAAPFSSFYFAVKDYAALALGNGSIYNHSDNPNARMIFDPEHSLVVFKALRSIKAGEEIYISYGKNWFDGRNLVARRPSWRSMLVRFVKTSPAIFRFGIAALALLALTFK